MRFVSRFGTTVRLRDRGEKKKGGHDRKHGKEINCVSDNVRPSGSMVPKGCGAAPHPIEGELSSQGTERKVTVQ